MDVFVVLLWFDKYYKKDDNDVAISWDEETWFISFDENKGKSMGSAYLDKDVQNLHNTTDWQLALSAKGGWKYAGEMLRVKGRYINTIDK